MKALSTWLKQYYHILLHEETIGTLSWFFFNHRRKINRHFFIAISTTRCFYSSNSFQVMDFSKYFNFWGMTTTTIIVLFWYFSMATRKKTCFSQETGQLQNLAIKCSQAAHCSTCVMMGSLCIFYCQIVVVVDGQLLAVPAQDEQHSC